MEIIIVGRDIVNSVMSLMIYWLLEFKVVDVFEGMEDDGLM